MLWYSISEMGSPSLSWYGGAVLGYCKFLLRYAHVSSQQAWQHQLMGISTFPAYEGITPVFKMQIS